MSGFSRYQPSGKAEVEWRLLNRSGQSSINTVNVIRISVPLCIFIVCSCGVAPTSNPGRQPCSEQWFQYVEEQLQTGDSEGHGPDLGSSEWRSVVEFKLGVRGDPDVPHRETEQWCAYIDARVRQ